MSNPPYGGVELPFLKGDLEGFFIRTYVEYSKFKVQNPFGHWDFGHLILFSISDLGFRICFSEIATPSARNDRKGVIARSGSDEAIPKLNPKLKALNPKQIPISIVNHKTIYNLT